MSYSRRPTAVVNAPVRTVWGLLTKPAGWGNFFDVRITGTSPDGPAAVGQKIYAESGPPFLRLKLEFEFVEIDPDRHRLGLDVRLPFDLRVRENLDCIPLDTDHCRVNYHCDFSLPAGWRGALARLAMRRELDAGPVDSLSRLKRAAEELHALAPT